MARNGSFGGGSRGGRSGSFSSGSSGRSGSFSSGSSGRSGSFSGGNFSSFKKSSGTTTPSKPTSVHTNRSSFLTGAIVGSVLSNSGNRGNNTYYGGAPSNDVFPEVSGSNYTPRSPEPPKGREYMHCEYCGSDYNDLNITKCQNCGAKTTHKREEVKTAGFVQRAATAYSQITPTAEQKPKNKKTALIIGIVVFIIIFAVVMSFLSHDNYYDDEYDYDYEFTPETFEWHEDNNIFEPQFYNQGEMVYGEILNLKVVSSSVVSNLSSYGINYNEYYYCVTQVNIINTGEDYYFFLPDLTLSLNGELYVASSLTKNSKKLFSERNEEGYMVIRAGEDFTITFIFPIDNYQNLSTLNLEFREFDEDGNPLGIYLIYLG